LTAERRFEGSLTSSTVEAECGKTVFFHPLKMKSCLSFKFALLVQSTLPYRVSIWIEWIRAAHVRRVDCTALFSLLSALRDISFPFSFPADSSPFPPFVYGGDLRRRRRREDFPSFLSSSSSSSHMSKCRGISHLSDIGEILGKGMSGGQKIQFTTSASQGRANVDVGVSET